MVSVSFSAFLLVALVAITQVVASPTAPRACHELHPRNGATREYVQPWFTPTKTSNLIRKEWESTDGTKVQLKHLFQLQGNENILLIKTTDALKKHRVELGFAVNGDSETSRYFKLEPSQTCYVPADNNPVEGINAVSYYHRTN